MKHRKFHGPHFIVCGVTYPLVLRNGQNQSKIAFYWDPTSSPPADLWTVSTEKRFLAGDVPLENCRDSSVHVYNNQHTVSCIYLFLSTAQRCHLHL